MATRKSTEIETEEPLEVLAPERQTAPLVFASPHSGTRYPPDFVASSPLDLRSLRRSEDSFVDELFSIAPELGLPLLRALFPRAYIDPNREPFELDPAMFEDDLPAYANTQSSRVAAGLGTIARVVSSGQEIYDGKLKFADAAQRINDNYRPYHKALKDLLDETRERFRCFVLVDCHSMPSVGGPHDPDAGRERADFVLGDAFGASCGEVVIRLAQGVLESLGYTVVRNKPFSGGFSTRHYGRPSLGMHAIQIEVNRALYMDEVAIRQNDGMSGVVEHMGELITALSELSLTDLRAK